MHLLNDILDALLMPVLAKEECLYPDTLLEGADDADLFRGLTEGLSRRWWVVYSKARQEKAIARAMFARACPFYLPLVTQTSFYRGRKVSSYSPMFPGYVFLLATEEEREACLATNRVSRLLPVADGCRLRRDLGQVHRMIASDVPLTVESRLDAGDRVRVRCGPLCGIEGTILVRRGQTRLLVSVDFLQQGASVEIDDFMVEPVGV